MKNIFLPFLTLLITCNLANAQFNITFELNTETIAEIDPSGIYIAGGNGFGSPGDNQLTDSDGDGIYTITLQREEGFSSHYTFLNGNCPDYTCKENLTGLPCGDPGNFNDRFLSPVMGDRTIKACFGTCDDDGSCTIVTDSIDITFELNTANIQVDPNGIFIAGGGNFGNPGDNPMIDPDGDGIYTFTTRRLSGFASYYTFTNGICPDFTCKEDLAGLPCGDPLNFNDRFLPLTTSDTTIKACFGNCNDTGGCEEVTEFVDITFELNTVNIEVDAGGIFLAGGGSFGFPGDNPMIDPEGDGIYTITVTRPVGFSSFYTFTNGNCPDFTCKEDLEGLPCANPNAFNDRFLPATMTNTTIQACFGTCDDDGSCSPTSVNGIEIDQNLFTIQPTIVTNLLNINFNENDNPIEKEITIVNAIGETMYTTSLQNQLNYQLETNQFSNGIYFINVQSEGKMLTKKFIVQK